MKISVIGPCQAAPLAECLSVMNPALRVERFLWDGDPGPPGGEHLIFRQRNRRTIWAPAEARPGEFLYPRLWFEGRDIDFPIAGMLSRWERRGWFMYAPNHPALFVVADIARELVRRAGLVPALTTELTSQEARRANYRVFSTRSGNIYTARQLVQLFDRAYGTFVPSDRAWLRPDGRYADPFRVMVEPDGFASEDELLESREGHLTAVRTMFERLDVLIFTLGLTEAWQSTADGAVFSAAPGSVAGEMDASRYEFVNFSAAGVRADLDAFLARLQSVNAGARVVLTVSPVPLSPRTRRATSC